MTRSIPPCSDDPRSAARTRPVWLALALAAPLLVATHASAEQACGDAPCPQGYTCRTAPGACPAIACAEENCPPCEAPDAQFCVPAACETDSDCGAGMACTEYTSSCEQGDSEPTPDCPPGAECGKPEPGFAPTPPEECAPSTQLLCTPHWQLPCDVADDCGPGFDCVEQESCSSSGSQGTASGSGSSAGAGSGETPNASDRLPMKPASGGDSIPPSVPSSEPREEPVVSCEPTGIFACVARVKACTSDTDCESGWTCGDNPNGVCWSRADGQTGCEPADPPKLCSPPYSDLSGYGGTRGVATQGEFDASVEPPTVAPGNAAVGSPGSSSSWASGGCALHATPSPSSGLTLLALGLAAALGLRRRR